MTKEKVKSVWVDYPSFRHLASVLTSIAVVGGFLWWFAEAKVNAHIDARVDALNISGTYAKISDVAGINGNVGDVSSKVGANSEKINKIDLRGVRLEAETKAINDKVDDVRDTLRNIERYMMDRSRK